VFKKIFFFVLLFFLVNQSRVFVLASDSPNNKFGIHLAQPEDQDLEAAAKLVNSSGGDWGYITLVIQENDRNHDKWQDIFNKLRRLRLIPIIRLATKPDGASWHRPRKDDIEEWVDFLDSLNWVIKDRYIILFNEPNHASEWGGVVDAENYAEVAKEFAEKLEAKNKDFFIMLAGFDAAAPHQPPNFEDEAIFIRKMFNISRSTFDFLDGWVSHSYPNPGFVGSPYDFGRNSVRGYQWELTMLKEIGVTKELSVFITETGWTHNQHQISNIKYQKELTPEVVADYFKTAFENIWLRDERVKTVTPFILNYQGEPFAHFSWALPGRADFYPQYFSVQKIQKIKGEPEQKHKVTVSAELPQELVEKSTYSFNISIENQGQSILEKNDGYKLSAVGDQFDGQLEYFFSDLIDLEPSRGQTIDFHLKTTDKLGSQQIKVGLFKDNKLILDLFSWGYEVSPWPSLNFKVNLFPKLKTEGTDFELQIFDRNEQLVYKKRNITVINGQGLIERIGNITLNEPHRIVILKPHYLPRQEYIIFQKDRNEITFKKMLPLDFNGDGKLSFYDLIVLVKNLRLLGLWWIR
jgi:hypothetical protein